MTAQATIVDDRSICTPLFTTKAGLLRCVETVLPIVDEASKRVLSLYNAPEAISVEYKGDLSPLTNADMASHNILTAGIGKQFPDIRIVSEEAPAQHNSAAMQDDVYWLIDPIDGTQQFVKRNGQFTICVALMVFGRPVLGISAVPVMQEVFYGGPKLGSYKITHDGRRQQLHVSAKPTGIICGSISRPNTATAAYITEQYAQKQIEEYGSLLKFTRVAEGLADAYPRLGTTMKLWDVAAGQAIVEGAGGVVVRPDGTAIDYHSQDFMVGDFVAKAV